MRGKILLPTFFLAFGLLVGWMTAPVSNPFRAGLLTTFANNENPVTEKEDLATGGVHQRQGSHRSERARSDTEDLAVSLATAYAEKLPRRRLHAFLELLDNVTPENAAVLRERVLSWPVVDDTAALCQKLFIARCGEVEGLAAVNAVTGDLSQAALQGWAAADRASLLAYIETLPTRSSMRSAAVAAIVGALAQEDLGEASRYAFQEFSDDSSLVGPILEKLIQSAKDQNRGALFAEWFDAAPEGPARAGLAYAAVDHLRSESPKTAAEWLDRVGTPEWRKADLYWPTAKAWAYEDPKAAFDWVVKLPNLPGEIAPPGFAAVIEAWTEKDPENVVAWVASNTAEPWWPRAARGVVKGFHDGGRAQDAEAFIARFPEPLRQAITKDFQAANMVVPQ